MCATVADSKLNHNLLGIAGGVVMSDPQDQEYIGADVADSYTAEATAMTCSILWMLQTVNRQARHIAYFVGYDNQSVVDVMTGAADTTQSVLLFRILKAELEFKYNG